MVDLWRDFWIRETGTVQQATQLHDRRVMMMMMIIIIIIIMPVYLINLNGWILVINGTLYHTWLVGFLSFQNPSEPCKSFWLMYTRCKPSCIWVLGVPAREYIFVALRINSDTSQNIVQQLVVFIEKDSFLCGGNWIFMYRLDEFR